MKVLNLYAGIGGNRKLWGGVEVTAIEYNPEIACIYKDYYPNDTVVIGDAHDFLLNHYKEYDFIWASPPCPSHSKIRLMASKRGDYAPIFPDMTLWQEIIFLQAFTSKDQLFVVENVKPYYDPIIKESVELERHLFWSNFKIHRRELEKVKRKHNSIKNTDQLYGYDLTKYNIKHDKVKILRNMVNPDLGLYIMEQGLGYQRMNNSSQTRIEL